MPVAIEKMAVLRATRPPPAAAVPGRAGAVASGGPDKAAIVRRCAACGRGCSARALQAMANIDSQKKRILRSERERLENRRYTSAIKTHFRRLQAAAEGEAGSDADAVHRELVSTIDKAVKVGALHRNTGARKKARAARVVAAGKPASAAD
jgi:small subunit ribosomal protein S20